MGESEGFGTTFTGFGAFGGGFMVGVRVVVGS